MTAPFASIVVLRREVYGNEVYYPVCKQAGIYAQIAGTKTLTRDTLKLIRALGVTIQTTHQQQIALDMA